MKQDLILTYEDKKELLEEINQDDLMDLFKDYKTTYKPLKQKKSQLDQKISAGITAAERDLLTREFDAIKKAGNLSRSAMIRNKVIAELDIAEWEERARNGLKDFEDEKWDEAKLKRNLKHKIMLLDNVEDDDEESEIILTREITELERQISELSKPTIRRGFRITGRVTFNEANHIRWRAARLTITVADYVRFMLFDYYPFTEADQHMSIDARKRFYISVLDVARNGWGRPPHVEECPNCQRYAEEAQAYKEKLERLQRLYTEV